MSRIGKLPVVIPDGVKVSVEGEVLFCEGKKGKLRKRMPSGIELVQEDRKLFVKPITEGKRGKSLRKARALWGLARTLCQNMITGVHEGFEKVLEISGVGYRWEVQKNELIVQAGFSRPVRMAIPDGIEVKVEQNKIFIRGADKEILGDYAARIRKVRKVEPYKGKGIRYLGEYVRRKAGKAGKVGAK